MWTARIRSEELPVETAACTYSRFLIDRLIERVLRSTLMTRFDRSKKDYKRTWC